MSVLICARVNVSRKPFSPNILLFAVAELSNKAPLRRVPLRPHLKAEHTRFFESHLENPGSGPFIPDSILLLHVYISALCPAVGGVGAAEVKRPSEFDDLRANRPLISSEQRWTTRPSCRSRTRMK